MYGRRDFGGNREEAGARTVWVESLPGYVDEEFLRHQLASYTIMRFKVNTRANSGKGDKYAFLEFDSRESAAQFMETYQGKSLPGIQGAVKLDFALQNSKQLRGAAGGGGFGGFEDRDHFSIFVGELSDDVTEEALMGVFTQYFRSVRSAKVVKNPATGASRGFGFVRFSDERDKERALATMQGFLIGHRHIRVRSATGKNEPPPAEPRRQEPMGAAEMDPNHATLFVGNVSGSVTDEALKQVFSVYGPIVYARVPPGKGCGFVQMVHRSHAEAALAHAHGQVVGGQTIRVAWGKNNNSAHSSAAAAAHAAYQPAAYESYDYQAYDTTQAMDPNMWHAQMYSYDQAYQEQAAPTEVPGIGPWHPSLTNAAHQVLHEKAQGTGLGTAGANAELLLRNQVSILGPLLPV